MRPLNGKRAMTRDERNRHRRMMDLNPFHHEMTLRTARRWRKKHQEELNARRRERYANDPEYREREKKRQREWGERNKESKAKAWKRWADRNREKLRARDRARSKTQKEAERRKVQAERRRERMKTDAEYAERTRAQKRESWQRRKHTEAGRRWYERNLLVPKWEEVAEEGAERISSYLKRCRTETRRLFSAWYSKRVGLLDTVSPAKEVDESLNY